MAETNGSIKSLLEKKKQNLIRPTSFQNTPVGGDFKSTQATPLKTQIPTFNRSANQQKLAPIPGVNESLPEFELLRKQFMDRNQAQTQQADDAMKREFARLGNLNSGSRLKQVRLLQDEAAKRENEGLGQIAFQEAQTKRGLTESERQRQFQSGMFEDEMSLKAAQMGMSKEQFEQQFGLQKDISEFEKRTKLKELDLASQELDMDRQTLMFNKAVSAVELGNFDALNGWMNYFEGKGEKPTGNLNEGSHICTEMHKRGITTKLEMRKMYKFFRKVLIKQPVWGALYLKFGKSIVEAANDEKFDWNEVKRQFIDDTLSILDNFGVERAMDHYGEMVFKLERHFGGRVKWQSQ